MEKKEYQRNQQENAEVICRKIKEEVEGEANEIIAVAQKEAAAIRTAAENEARKKTDALLKNFHRESQVLKEKIFSTLTLEKKRIILDEKNKFIEEVFERITKEAQEFRHNPDYINFLTKAMLDGIVTVDAENIDVLYSSFDEKIMTDDFKKIIETECHNRLGKVVSLQLRKNDFKDIGVIVQSLDGHRMCDNRFLSRFARLHEELYMSLMREVF